MPFTYCTECGYKNVFTTRKAKFCAGCGQPFVEEKASLTSVAQDDSQNNPIEGIPNIQKLEYTVDATSKPPTVGDLINTRDEGSEQYERNTGKVSKASTREEIEAESMRECGTSINRSAD